MLPAAADIRSVKRRLRRRNARRLLLPLPLILLSLLVLAIALWMPVLQIQGMTMAPVLENGDSVVAIPRERYQPGQIIAFRCQGQILTRRVIAGPGSTVDLDSSGNVTVDGVLLNEPYVTVRDLGDLTTAFPCSVPEGHYFVLGDNRSNPLDSRSAIVGCVPDGDILGVIFWRLLPLDRFGNPN